LSLEGFGGVNNIANGVVKVGGTFRWKDHAGIIATKSTRKASHKEAQKAQKEEDSYCSLPFVYVLFVPFCG